MRGVTATKFVSGRQTTGRFRSALLGACLLLTAPCVQAKELGGNAAAGKAAPEAAQGEMPMAANAAGAATAQAVAPAAAPAPAPGGVPNSMMAPSPFTQAATAGKPATTAESAPVAPPAIAPAKPEPVAPVQATAPAGINPAPAASQPASTMAAGEQPAATPGVIPVANEKSNEKPSDFTGRKADYYDNRAKEKLAEESKADGPGRLHPLQLASPSHNVIVCEAGCLKDGVSVVSKTLKATVRPAIAPLSADMPVSGVVGRDRTLDCRGGCDRPTVRMGLGGPAVAAAPKMLNDTAGRWLTSVTPEAPAPLEPTAMVPKLAVPVAPAPVSKVPVSKAPMIEAAPVAPAAAPGKAAKVSREDWLARINRERAADKAADRAADILEPAKPE